MEERIEEFKIQKTYIKDFGSGKKAFTAFNILVDIEIDGQVEQRWLNGYENKQNRDWVEGDTVTVKVFEKDATDKNGNTILGYKIPDAGDLLGIRIERLEKMIEGIYKMNKFIYQKIKQGDVGASLYEKPKSKEPFDYDKEMKAMNEPALGPEDKKPRGRQRNGPSMNNPPDPPPKKGKTSGDLPPWLQDQPPIDEYE